jgi:cytochrome c oxidase subunit 3
MANSHAPAEQHPAFAHHFDTMAQQREASSLGMWVFLATEIMFFGGLILAYLVYRVAYFEAFAAGSHHLSIPWGAANTAVLLGSSLTMALAVHAAQVGRRKATVVFLLLTIVLGSVFLGVKVIEYADKFSHHLVPGFNFQFAAEGVDPRHAEIYFSLYFAMTGMHAVHMILGVGLLATLVWYAWRGRYTPDYYSPVENVGLYWHFVDIVWIFLFPLLYLIH